MEIGRTAGFEHQKRRPVERERTGDVWKAVVALRRRSDCDVAVLNVDWGLGVVLPRPNSRALSNVPELTWEAFMTQRDELLRVVDFPGLELFLNGRRPQYGLRMSVGWRIACQLDACEVSEWLSSRGARGLLFGFLLAEREGYYGEGDAHGYRELQ